MVRPIDFFGELIKGIGYCSQALAMIFLQSGHFDHALTYPELARRLTAK
jgi:hypothetical protein